jgi:hypothetical protein
MIIVFAHFNTTLPKHLVLNLERTIETFPQHDIYLITNLNPSSINIKKLIIFTYKPSKIWIELENLLAHDKSFRSNFWFTSLARFIALSEFSSSINQELLHIESDVIISDDFPFDLMLKIESWFAYPVVNESLAIASCLFIKNPDAANYLSQLTISNARINGLITDMHVLGEISKKGSGLFTLLPTSPSQNNALTSVSNNFLHENHQSISFFKGIFDGFDLGMYLFGNDPRNKRGFSTLRKFDTRFYLNVRELNFIIKDDRDFPYIYNFSESQYIPVFALHIHSKNLKLFKIHKNNKEIKRAIKNSKKNSRTVFYPKIFIKSLLSAAVRRINLNLNNTSFDD